MGKIKKWYVNISIKKAFFILTIIGILIALLISVIILTFSNIGEKYRNTNYIYVSENGTMHIERTNTNNNITKTQKKIIFFIQDILYLSPIIIFSLVMILISFVFYNTKLKKPLTMMMIGLERIANKDLDFSILYNTNDEMGSLCEGFEKMRKEILYRQQVECKTKEEKTRMYRSFSHDLRTPLTIIKGHIYMINKNISSGINISKLKSTVELIGNNLERIEDYVNNINALEKLDDIEPCIFEVDINKFINDISKNYTVLVEKNNKKLIIKKYDIRKKLYFDPELVKRVLDNIISNSMRYANKNIKIEMFCENKFIFIKITDDGKGFDSEEIKNVLDPFYKSKRDLSTKHIGLGLHIANVLCKKHGGNIDVSNSVAGGGIVSVSFNIHE
ncbi:MAG: HAMP domain-containing sensor histidine kinase [Clostridiales bacterium]